MPKNSSVKQHFATNSLKPHEGNKLPVWCLGRQIYFLILNWQFIFFNTGVSASLLCLRASGQNQSRDRTQKKKTASLQSLNIDTTFVIFFSVAGVNHILEVYDLPKGMQNNEKEELFEDLIKAGARIKWLNSSASASKDTPVLAIFSSSVAADHALNSMQSSKFKLRLHQNTSAFAHADSNASISSLS